MKSGKVLTNMQQSLTEAEKAQARANIDAASTIPPLFVQPTIHSGNRVSNENNSFYLMNITNQYTLALIGLRPSGGYHVNSGDMFEVIMNGVSFSFVIPTLLSMGLFKMVGHPPVGSLGLVTFRRLTEPLAPRTFVGVRNDGGVPPYGQEPVAENPITFTFDEDADFNNGELLYFGIALAFDSNKPNYDPVLIGGFPQTPVDDYQDPTDYVCPVYYAQGQSDKIGADGFTAREFTIGYSDADFSYASTFSRSSNVLEINADQGILARGYKTYPEGIMLMKKVPV